MIVSTKSRKGMYQVIVGTRQTPTAQEDESERSWLGSCGLVTDNCDELVGYKELANPSHRLCKSPDVHQGGSSCDDEKVYKRCTEYALDE